MDTLLIQVTNQNAYSLLNELEKLHFIKVLKKENGPSKSFRKNTQANYPQMPRKNYRNILNKAVRNGICDR